MSGLDNLKCRLEYRGGQKLNRLIEGKANSLWKALANSYQSNIVISQQGQEIPALINPDKLHPDYKNKIISTPYELKDGSKNPLTVGSVFTWKENNTHWIIYLQHLTEKAYFHGEIRQCKHTIELDDQTYWVYIRGPVETSIPWNQKQGIAWNDMNYSLVMYITKDDFTTTHLSRFSKIKIKEDLSDQVHTWQVVSKNLYYGDGIIEIFLDEYFENEFEKDASTEVKPPIAQDSLIEGKTEIVRYSDAHFQVKSEIKPGRWFLLHNNNKIALNSQDSCSIDFLVNYKRGDYILMFQNQEQAIQLPIRILAF